ncbi:MAG: sulfite exporter TauE/SafE family protein [Mariniphaga sp.]|nr:sulfite exporter TauE/SafE family protein [Mariniphaga sp.]
MEYIFLVSLFVIAFLYSSVGHGGGSGYLALMAIVGIAPEFMRSTSLTLNIFVSLIAFIAYFNAGFFRSALIIPFLLSSIPMAYIGALLPIQPTVYKIILAIFLHIAIARMLFIPNAVTEQSKKPPFAMALLIGAVLGLLSGMIGIGGGIILSPILILLHWANMKEAAAASALFIFLNSISGLVGLFHTGFNFNPHIISWIVVGVAGGIAGSYSGSFKIHANQLKYILATVLLVASIKLFLV